MIVLWDRIRNAAGGIRDTEWLLLVLEAFGVVIGVFLAFQLQEWAEDQREARAQESLMGRLLEESRQNLLELRDTQKRRYDRVMEAADLVDRMNAGTCPSPEEFRAFWRMDFYPTVSVPETAYLEMINSIGLSGIDDYAARSAIAEYRRDVEFFQGQNEHFRSAPSIIDQELDGINYRYDRNRGSLTRLDVDMPKLCGNPRFVNAVNQSTRNQHRMQQYRYQIVQSAAHMCFELARLNDARCFEGVLDQFDQSDRDEIIAMDARLHDGDLEFHEVN